MKKIFSFSLKLNLLCLIWFEFGRAPHHNLNLNDLTNKWSKLPDPKFQTLFIAHEILKVWPSMYEEI